MGEKGKETIEKTIRSGRVRAICTSERRGTEKHAVSEARFEKGYGIRGDAHAGNWHRQVSLLSYDKVKEFNERTAKQGGLIIPVEITVFEDRSFTFVTKTPPAAVLLKKAAGIEKASGEPNKKKVAKVSRAKAREIAESKMQDLNAADVEAATRMIEGTARSMGIEIVD